MTDTEIAHKVIAAPEEYSMFAKRLAKSLLEAQQTIRELLERLDRAINAVDSMEIL